MEPIVYVILIMADGRLDPVVDECENMKKIGVYSKLPKLKEMWMSQDEIKSVRVFSYEEMFKKGE